MILGEARAEVVEAVARARRERAENFILVREIPFVFATEMNCLKP